MFFPRHWLHCKMSSIMCYMSCNPFILVLTWRDPIWKSVQRCVFTEIFCRFLQNNRCFHKTLFSPEAHSHFRILMRNKMRCYEQTWDLWRWVWWIRVQICVFLPTVGGESAIFHQTQRQKSHPWLSDIPEFRPWQFTTAYHAWRNLSSAVLFASCCHATSWCERASELGQ